MTLFHHKQTKYIADKKHFPQRTKKKVGFSWEKGGHREAKDEEGKKKANKMARRKRIAGGDVTADRIDASLVWFGNDAGTTDHSSRS